MILVKFQVDTKYGPYVSSLCLPDNHNFSDSDLEAFKMTQVENYINSIENPIDQSNNPIDENGGIV